MGAWVYRPSPHWELVSRTAALSLPRRQECSQGNVMAAVVARSFQCCSLLSTSSAEQLLKYIKQAMPANIPTPRIVIKKKMASIPFLHNQFRFFSGQGLRSSIGSRLHCNGVPLASSIPQMTLPTQKLASGSNHCCFFRRLRLPGLKPKANCMFSKYTSGAGDGQKGR